MTPVHIIDAFGPIEGYVFVIKARNGRDLVESSNVYTRKRDAVRAARLFVKSYMNSVADIYDNTVLSIAA
jgi:uncharacterized protein YegP (UPF0339 family)